MTKRYYLTGGLFAASGVILGAFGAHSLKDVLSEYGMGVWEKAVFYQFIHAVAILIVTNVAGFWPGSRITRANLFFAAGILLFSGSLYNIALTGIKTFGMITPLGGIAFVAGWCIFCYEIIKNDKKGV